MLNAEEQLRQSQESKTKANEKATEAVTRLEESHGNMQQIVQEKKSLEMELKVKERECNLLSTMQEKDEALNQFLQTKINKKRKKIKSLKEELQRKECELQSALQEVQTRQEELTQARKELKNKHAEVIQLQREKEELASSYNIEKEQVSKLVQITFALTSDKEEMKVTQF